MIQMYLCRHHLELLTRAVKAYQPASDEKVEHQDLLEYLTMRTEEGASVELDPEDIPF